MKVEQKQFDIEKDVLFEVAIKCLKVMKWEIKLDNKGAGIIVGFIESLASYPSGELILIEITLHDSRYSLIKISSESMAVHSRLFKKKRNDGNISRFFNLVNRLL